jgi:hypothetical protein
MNIVPLLARVSALVVLLFSSAACSDPAATGDSTTPSQPPAGNVPPVQVVLFTHIEDQTPAGTLGSATNRTNYLAVRNSLLQMAALARRYQMRWSFEPDWKILLAALQYEDSATTANTAGRNFLRFLRDSLGAAIDPHSHEGGGYNYTDVAHLLDSLGVGGSTVIGGHIWDPALPQFARWDRFRVPVNGLRYPHAVWRGDILMGSGTPNHTNDPTISGVWRPRSRDQYFEDDPAGNIACVGAFKGDVPGIAELGARYRNGQTPVTCMLTASIHIRPADIMTSAGLTAIENNVLRPLATMRDSGQIVLTDFTALVAHWRQAFGARACTYRITT